jgi:hypothetical protein
MKINHQKKVKKNHILTSSIFEIEKNKYAHGQRCHIESNTYIADYYDNLV